MSLTKVLALEDWELANPNELTAEQYEKAMEVPCPAENCTAKRRHRVGVDKFSKGELEYPDCRDEAGDFAGLVHVGRIRAAF